MNIIFRHTLRSVGKNKLQAIVIFLTIVAVTMMIFAALSMTGLFYNINISEYRRMAGDSDMLIGDRAGGAMFARATVENVAQNNPDIASVNYFLRGTSLLRGESANFPIFVEATDISTFARPENGFFLVEEASAGEYPSAFISERFQKEYAVGLGSVIELLSPVSNKYVKFNVTHILESKGFFGSAVANQVVVDLAAVDSMGLVNNAYITFQDSSLFGAYEEKFQSLLPTANIEDALSETDVRAIANNNTLLLSVAVVFITVIMMLILFSSYLIIAKTRMSELVLFKAAGASPRQTVWILLSEVLLYGVLGSALGVLLGRIAMGWAVESLLPYASSAISYEFWKFFVGFLLGVTVSVLSALSPMMSVAKKSIRELTQGEVKEVKKGKPWLAVVLTFVVAAFAITMFLVTGTTATIILFLSIPFLVAWLATIMKYMVKFVSLCASKIVKRGGGALGAVTARRSGQVLSVSSLVAIIVAFAFMVIATIDIVVIAVTPFNSRYTADIVLSAASTMTFSEREAARAQFSKIEGVTDSASYGTMGFRFENLNGDFIGDCNMISVTTGKDIAKVSTSFDTKIPSIFDNTIRPIVLNYEMAERLNLKEGDKVRLYRIESLATEEIVEYLDGEFTVMGIEYTATEWDRVAIMNMKDLLSSGEEVAINGGIFLNGTSSEVFCAVREVAETDGTFITLHFEDWFNSSSKGLEGVVMLLRFAETLFGFIAVLGILNISIVTFMDRKREFSIYRLAGMENKNYYRFHAVEGFIAAFSGATTGFCVAFFINRLMPILANLVNKFLSVPVFPLTLWATPLALGIGFFVLWLLLAWAFTKTYKNGDFRTDRSSIT